MGICTGETKQAGSKMKVFILAAALSAVCADFVGLSAEQLARAGRQEVDGAVQGGIDFSGCSEDPETGLCCVEKEETVTSLRKEPILECTHKNVEQCHYTYVTQFTPSQEEVCEEDFEKQCSITFKQQAYNETVKKCYKPVEKVCNGQGPEEAELSMSHPAAPSMLRNSQASLLETPLVRSSPLRSVVLDVPLRRDLKSVMTRLLLPLWMSQRRFVI